MPRFEFVEGTSRKFWEITLTGSSFTVRWGRIGATGQDSGQTFDSPAAAKNAHDKLIAAKVKKGYREVPAATDVARDRAAAAIAARAAAARPAKAAPPDRSFRRFEWDEGGARFFHELLLNGSSLAQRWGEVRAPDEDLDDERGDEREDQEQAPERHPRPADAREIFEHIVQVFGKRGYRLVAHEDGELVEEPVIRARRSENPELEAACRASPDAPEVWAVYADWLMSEGDPRGELAALHRGGKEAEARRFFKAHGEALLGDLEAHHGSGLRELRFRHGFPIGASLARPSRGSAVKLDELTRAFLALDLSRFVESLRFGLASHSSDNDWTGTIMAVAGSAQAPRVRELYFNDYTYEECELSWTPFGDFSKAWPMLPALEVLHIRSGGGGALGEIVLPSLKTFIRESGGLAGEEIQAICAARWPSLEHLAIWFGQEAYDAQGSVDSIQSILEGQGLPKLTHLGIVNCEFVDELIPALTKSPVLPRLRTLDLSKGVMATSAAAALIERAGAFAHLERIDLDQNLLLDDELDRIMSALPSVVSVEQRHREEDDGDNRYAAVGE